MARTNLPGQIAELLGIRYEEARSYVETLVKVLKICLIKDKNHTLSIANFGIFMIIKKRRKFFSYRWLRYIRTEKNILIFRAYDPLRREAEELIDVVKPK